MDRGLAKPAWKFLYRLMRVGRREAEKASVDCMIFGTGVVVIDENGPRHVPIEEWRAEVKAAAVNDGEGVNK